MLNILSILIGVSLYFWPISDSSQPFTSIKLVAGGIL